MKLMNRMRSAAVMAASSLALLASAAVHAEDYPTRPIQVIVGFSAGGAMDNTIRTLVPTLEKILGQSVVIINRPGAGGAIGWVQVARAKPDGYTLGSFNYPAISGATASGDLPVDPLTAFAFLGDTVVDPSVIVVPASSPYHNLKDIIAYLRGQPGGLTYGATGTTSLDGLTALALASEAKAKFRVVNFEGTPQAVTAALGHHIDALGMAVSEVGPFLSDGSLRVLAVGGGKRDPRLPNVPTFKELGVDLPISSSGRGLVAPAGTSPAIVKKLQDAIRQAAESESYKTMAGRASLFVSYESPDNVRSEMTKQIEFLKTALPK